MRHLLTLLLLGIGLASAQPIELKPNDVIALVGGSNIERTRFNGYLQTALIAAKPELNLKVRNFGWEGDTVFEQWRDGGDVEKLDAKRREAERRIQADAGSTSWRQQRDWRQQLSEVGATVVIAQFGQMESLAGKEGLPRFIAAYERLIAELADNGRRVVLLGPVPFDGAMAKQHGESLAAYAQGISGMAERLGLAFIQCFPDDGVAPPRPSQILTANNYQLNDAGHERMAWSVAYSLGLVPAFGLSPTALPSAHAEPTRTAVIEFERLWFDYWRPMNWAFLTGDRSNVPYSKDWKDSSKRIFPQEMQDFLPLLDQAEANIRSALAGKPTTPIAPRSSIPVEPPSAKPQSPDEELASFQILDGFAVNLFASEADGIVKPIQMRWDERGRLWVSCAVSYPQIKPGEKANDYILVCEDTDGDGRADKFTRWAEGLFMPTGIELGDGGLYVAQGTELLHLRDTNGDGKADTRRVVLGGFGTADSHQMINCINWGFGGELWFTQGHHIYSRVETPFGVETLNRAGLWRYRPRTGHLDPFFQWSSAGANCWGVVTTPDGQPFHKSGANIGSYYSTPGLVRSNLAVNAQAMNLCLAPIKQVGMEFLHSSHFPADMQGRIIIGGYYANLLEQHELIFDQATGLYSTKLLPNIIETKNNVFRPVEVRMGPDGAIYVADWYNPIIGHYQASYRHPDRDKAHGRIWRVTAKGRPVVKPVDLVKASTEQLLDLCSSPERYVAYQAKRLLFERSTQEITKTLAERRQTVATPMSQLHTLSVLEAHETPDLPLLKRLLRDDDAKIRAYATRTLSTWARDNKVPDALALLEAQITDNDALVRLEAIVAASYIADAKAAVLAAKALDQPFNAYHRHALTKTLHVLNALWAPQLAAGTLDFAKDEHLLFALQNAWVDNNPDDLKNLSGAPVDYKPNASSTAVSSVMRRQAERHAADPQRQGKWLIALANIASADDIAFLLKTGANKPEVLAALASSATARANAPANAAKVIGNLLENKNPALRAQGLRLAGAWKQTSFGERIANLAKADSTDEAERFAAIDALGQLGDKGSTTVLMSLLRDQAFNESAATHRALAALANADSTAAASIIAQHLKRSPSNDPAAAVARAKRFLQPLLSRGQGINGFVVLLNRESANQADEKLITPTSAKLMLTAVNQLGITDKRLASRLMKLAGINEALPAYTKDYLANLVKAVNTHGNAAEGKKIYEAAGCIACHMPGVVQSKIGPDLSAVSKGLPLDMILTEIIWPALNVKEGYEAATVTLKDGSIVTGFKHTDTADTITLRDPATQALRPIKKADTAKIQTGGSLMPDSLAAALNEQQLAHLAKYLSTLGQ